MATRFLVVLFLSGSRAFGLRPPTGAAKLPAASTSGRVVPRSVHTPVATSGRVLERPQPQDTPLELPPLQPRPEERASSERPESTALETLTDPRQTLTTTSADTRVEQEEPPRTREAPRALLPSPPPQQMGGADGRIKSRPVPNRRFHPRVKELPDSTDTSTGGPHHEAPSSSSGSGGGPPPAKQGAASEVLVPGQTELHVPAPLPGNEDFRLQFLESLALPTVADVEIDEITVLLQRLFQVPMVLVSIIEEHKQWFKARIGVEQTEMPRDISACAHTLTSDAPELLLISDSKLDPRTQNNPLCFMPDGVRFYCGAPVILNGIRIGAVCVMDRVPRIDITRRRALILANFSDLISSAFARSSPQNPLVNLQEFPTFFLESPCPEEGRGGPEVDQHQAEAARGTRRENWDVMYVNQIGRAKLAELGLGVGPLRLSDVVVFEKEHEQDESINPGGNSVFVALGLWAGGELGTLWHRDLSA